jgi:Flp pilus assembly protein TadG
MWNREMGKEEGVLKDRAFRRRRERGASLVELSLVLFILILLVAGVIDFGRAFNSYVVITNASREGARYASRRAPGVTLPESVYKDGILAAVKRETAGSSVTLEDDDIEIDPDPEGPNTAGPSDPITVTVSYTVPTIIADIAGFGELPLRARTTMAIQGVESQTP